MKSLTFATLALLGYVESVGEPTYRIQESHSMETPLTAKEFTNWETKLSSIFVKDNIILVPELSDKKGAIMNKDVVPHKDDWLIDLKFRMGNTDRSIAGGAGLALYYLKDINQD